MHTRKRRTLAALLAGFLLMSLRTGPGYAVRETEAVTAEAEDAVVSEEADAERPAELADVEEDANGEEGDSDPQSGTVFLTPQDDLAQAFRDCGTDSDMLVILTEDVTFSGTATVTEGQNITLDLNGHSLTYAPEASAGRRNAIRVEGGRFTLKNDETSCAITSQADNVDLLSLGGGNTTVTNVALKVTGTDSVCIAAENKDAETSARISARLSLESSLLEGITRALNAKDYTVNISKDSTLQTSGQEDAIVIQAEDTNLYIRDSRIFGSGSGGSASITGIEALTGTSSSSKYLMLYNDTKLEVNGPIATGIQLIRTDCSLMREEEDGPSPTVTVRADGPAIGITAYDSSVGLGSSELEAAGETVIGVFSECQEQNSMSVMLSTNDTSLTVTGTKEATGVQAENITVWLAGQAAILSSAPSAVGLRASGGSVVSQDADTLITADARTAADGSAIALLIEAQREPDPDRTPPLYWENGSAQAIAVNSDSAFALAVDYPADFTADGTAQAVIQPSARFFEGRVCVLRDGEQVKNTGLLKILGGTFSVEPDAGDIAEGYAAEPTEDCYYRIASKTGGGTHLRRG